MDEPFGALDAVTRDNLQRELLALQKRLHKTIIFVTHDIFEALTLADRIAVMHEGNLEQVAEPGELISHPRTDFVRNLFEKPAQQLRAYRELT
jgi:osmoprotectant transport system ATP-binding protein